MLLFHTIADSDFNEDTYLNLLTVPRVFFKKNLVAKPFLSSVANTTTGHVLHHFHGGKENLQPPDVVKQRHFSVLKLFAVFFGSPKQQSES